MANVKWARSGYGMLERNRVQTDNIEAQCAVDNTAFPNGVEVGSIVGVNKAAGKIVSKTNGDYMGLLANSERLPDPQKAGLKNYKVEAGEMGVVIPLIIGNTFTTNTLAYDNTAYANATALDSALANAATTAVYGVPTDAGEIALVSSSANVDGTVLRVVKKTTMPDGQAAIKFIVVQE